MTNRTLGFQARRLAALLAAASLSAGCATGPVFTTPAEPPPDKAQLYVYRPWAMLGGSMHELRINEQKDYLRLPNGGWQRVLLAPGYHTVSIIDIFGVMRCDGVGGVTARAGETIYLAEINKSTVSYPSTISHGCSIEARSADKALADLAGLRNAE